MNVFRSYLGTGSFNLLKITAKVLKNITANAVKLVSQRANECFLSYVGKDMSDRQK